MENEAELVVELIHQALAAALLHEDQILYQQDVQQSFEAAGLSLEDAYPFALLIPILFDSLPKSSNGFRFAKNVTFDRNQDCVCGSGKKLKKCCPELMALPPVKSEEMFFAALSNMDAVALLRLADKQEWTKQALTALFDVAMENEFFEVVVKLAPTIMAQVNKLKNNDEELVAALLDALYEEGEHGLRLELIQQLIELRQAKSLRSLGYQRLAMIEAQRGSEALARKYLQQAIQADAKQAELPICELTVLGVMGSEQELKARAKFWLAFSLKRWGDDHPLVGFIEQVLASGKAMFDVSSDVYDETTPAAYDNATYLAGVLSIQGLPFVQVLEDSELGTGLYLKSSLIKQKLAFIEAFDVQVRMAKKEKGDSFHYDDCVAHTWHWPDLSWIDHLRQTPELLADFDVLEQLMPFVYQGPNVPEDFDVERGELSVFGLVPALFQSCCQQALKNTLDNLPKNTRLAEHHDANRSFWSVAFNTYMEQMESGQESSAKNLRKQLLSLTQSPQSWLVDNE